MACTRCVKIICLSESVLNHRCPTREQSKASRVKIAVEQMYVRLELVYLVLDHNMIALHIVRASRRGPYLVRTVLLLFAVSSGKRHFAVADLLVAVVIVVCRRTCTDCHRLELAEVPLYYVHLL